MNKGFVIMAQNTDSIDYVQCAEQLEKSIYRCVPNANVTIITTADLPHGDLAPDSDWKLINDWQVYEASPYEYTIKLEADMIIPTRIDHWWNVLVERDIVVCSTIRNFNGEVSNVRTYRQFIDDNGLPDVYNAITYFKKSDIAKDFFNLVKNIFENWEEYKKILKCNNDEIATTDWVYAIACHVMGPEITTLPFEQMSMVHMKQHINRMSGDDWTKEMVYEFGDTFKVNTIPQQYPFHYHIKSFSNVLRQHYG